MPAAERRRRPGAHGGRDALPDELLHWRVETDQEVQPAGRSAQLSGTATGGRRLCSVRVDSEQWTVLAESLSAAVPA